MVAKKYQNPKGGLNAQGRHYFKVKEGANLKAGVKKAHTPEQMRRKGSFLRRFYGRKDIPPLKDNKGRSTRYALAARAWGEPVPKTREDVRRLARKGKMLLERYRKRR